ncbi:conserved membrane hypothetical protein [Gammaproteobacteria bacterium]
MEVKIPICKTRGCLFLLVVLYLLVFNFAYIYLFNSKLGHSYIEYNRQPIGLYFFSIITLFALVPLFWLPVYLKKPSALFVWVFYMLCYIPSIYVSAYIHALSENQLLVHLFFMAISFGLLSVIPLLPPLHFVCLKINFNYLRFVFAGFSLLFCLFIWLKFRHILHWNWIDTTYIQRELYTNEIKNNNLWGYLIGYVDNAYAPFLIVFGFGCGSFLLMFCGCGCLLLIYFLTASKLTFLAMALLPLLMIVFSAIRNDDKIIFFILSLTGIITVSSILALFFHTDLLLYVVARRFLFDSGLGMAWYWKFFSQHQLVYLAESIFKFFIQYPYQFSIPYEVQYFATGTYGDVNANYLASAYANFGLIGMPYFSMILSVFLWLYDSITKGLDKTMVFMAVMYIAFLCSNSDLLVALNTHGIFVWLMLLYLVRSLPKKTYKNI